MTMAYTEAQQGPCMIVGMLDALLPRSLAASVVTCPSPSSTSLFLPFQAYMETEHCHGGPGLLPRKLTEYLNVTYCILARTDWNSLRLYLILHDELTSLKRESRVTQQFAGRCTVSVNHEVGLWPGQGFDHCGNHILNSWNGITNKPTRRQSQVCMGFNDVLKWCTRGSLILTGPM